MFRTYLNVIIATLNGQSSKKRLLIETEHVINRVFCLLKEMLLVFLLMPGSVLLCKRKRYMIISERGDEARDNGYHFFVYIRNHYPSIPAYYIIDKKSPDYDKVKQLGNIVSYKSLKHYYLFFGSYYRISTHTMGFSTDRGIYTRIYNYLPFPGYTISLKHGITKDNQKNLYFENTHLDLIFCGAKPEYDYIKNNFHYEEKRVKYTGFARFDSLHNHIENKQILIMPTWRNSLSRLTNVEFKQTDYFLRWNSLLNNQSFTAWATENQYDIVFYPHYEMQDYLHLFNTSSDKVILASFDKYDVQNLLKESSLLITDYSSVFFDFGYMNKPCIYYQFDKDRFFLNHYQKGYFDYDTMGFGPVVDNEADLLASFFDYYKFGFSIFPKYQIRINSFFTLKDSNNCERIYQEISLLE